MFTPSIKNARARKQRVAEGGTEGTPCMQVYIVLMELIPTALKFDPDNRILSRSVLVGMAAMAISLLFFTTSGLS